MQNNFRKTCQFNFLIIVKEHLKTGCFCGNFNIKLNGVRYSGWS